jgi:hypothetical protein
VLSQKVQSTQHIPTKPNRVQSVQERGTGPPTNILVSAGSNDVTYISALKETKKQLATERENAYATITKPIQPPRDTLMASTLNDFCTQLMTEVKNKMKKVLAAATTAAITGSNTGGGNNAGGGGWRKARGELTLCPHCNRKGTHMPEDCLMLPENATKKQTNFIDGRYVNQKRKE